MRRSHPALWRSAHPGRRRPANTGLGMLRGLAGVKPRQLVLVVADDDGTRYVVIE